MKQKWKNHQIEINVTIITDCLIFIHQFRYIVDDFVAINKTYGVSMGYVKNADPEPVSLLGILDQLKDHFKCNDLFYTDILPW